MHCDDLACSIGLPGVELPDVAADLAAELLVKLAIRRHGQAAVLRGLSRAERTPAFYRRILIAAEISGFSRLAGQAPAIGFRSAGARRPPA